MRYSRYADDFLLGFAGPKAEAETIKQKIKDFLKVIKLDLSEEKTLITHATTSAARNGPCAAGSIATVNEPQSMRTASAAGGAVDVQSDFLLDVRPMARVVAMIDRHVSVYLGLSLSWYDLTGKDDLIHGAAVSHRPSQLVFGIQLTPQGRTVATSVPASD